MPKKKPRPNAFEEIQKEAPTYPTYTCPRINEALDIMEELRDDNANLRDGLQFWRTHCRDLLKLLTAEQRRHYVRKIKGR